MWSKARGSGRGQSGSQGSPGEPCEGLWLSSWWAWMAWRPWNGILGFEGLGVWCCSGVVLLRCASRIGLGGKGGSSIMGSCSAYTPQGRYPSRNKCKRKMPLGLETWAPSATGLMGGGGGEAKAYGVHFLSHSESPSFLFQVKNAAASLTWPLRRRKVSVALLRCASLALWRCSPAQVAAGSPVRASGTANLATESRLAKLWVSQAAGESGRGRLSCPPCPGGQC